MKRERILELFKKNKWIIRLRIYFKSLFDRTAATNATFKNQFLQFVPFLVASVVTGFVAYLYSRIFSYSEELAFYYFHQNRILIFFITPVCFVLSWWLVSRYAPYARGSGIPQVMAAIELSKPQTNPLVRRLLSLRVIVVKVVSSAIKVIGGGILGREGPTVQISSSIFLQVNKWLPKWWVPVSQKNILIAGAASGLAAAFNTPLGGIIFAIEELSKYHIRHYKSPLFIAVIVAGLTAQGFGGSYLYLGYPKTDYTGWIIFVAMVFVAIVAGFFGSKMCQILLRVIRFQNSLRTHFKKLLFVLCCSFFVAGFIYYLGTDAMGSGKAIMERTLFTSDKSVPWYLPFVRMNGLIASFGFGGSGGVFAPSLSSGACFGAWTANFLDLKAGNADLLILIGMTAFLSGVTRAPFTSAIVVFEMTDRHSIIFFLLMGAVISNLVAYLVDKRSFYEQLSEFYTHSLTGQQVPEHGIQKPERT